MDSSDHYRAIPVDEQRNAFQPASAMRNVRSFATGGVSQLVGLIVLVVLTAFVTAHVTTMQADNRMSAVENTFAARSSYGSRSLKMAPKTLDDKYLRVVRGMVDDICNTITYTACRSNSARDTDWCKICEAYKY